MKPAPWPGSSRPGFPPTWAAHIEEAARRDMRLAQYQDGDAWRIGAVEGDEILDLATGDDRLPATIAELLNAGPDGLEAARRARRSARRRPLASVRLGPP